MQLDVAVMGLVAFLQRYRDTRHGFASAKIDVMVIAEELGIPPTFKPKRVARRKNLLRVRKRAASELLQKTHFEQTVF